MGKGKPLISIILPTFNRAKLLNRAIKSVIAQSFENWELIIVVDGSTDETLDVITSYRDSRIHHIYQENIGRGGVRNMGIKRASGRYITFLDDDDYYLTEHLKTLEQIIIGFGFPVANIRSEGYIETESGERKKLEKCPGFFPDAMEFLWLKGTSPMFFTFHNTVLDQLKFDDRFNYAQDFHLIVKAILVYPTFFTQKHTVVLFEHEQRGTSQLDSNKLNEMIASRLGVIFDLFENYYSSLRKYLSPKQIVRKISMDHVFLSNKAARLGNTKVALKLLFQAFHYNFSFRNIYHAGGIIYHLVDKNFQNCFFHKKQS
ncbi:MAG: glycosyltransferase family 2 protein [Phaeodactylibacter sp.]|nr:glycosyltransferase family 2 protein [Phaeodactylibacter sp.]